MADRIAKNVRSAVMARVRSKDTKPELAVRKLLTKLGYRYRLHKKGLPGTPDIVFAGRKKVIFVHGCFWHGHACSAGRNVPASRRTYWEPKLKRNKLRDKQNLKQLEELGWKALIVWECDLKDTDKLNKRLSSFLDKD